MRGVGRTAEHEETFKMRPFLRLTICPTTMAHMFATDEELQFMIDLEKANTSGIYIKKDITILQEVSRTVLGKSSKTGRSCRIKRETAKVFQLRHSRQNITTQALKKTKYANTFKKTGVLRKKP